GAGKSTAVKMLLGLVRPDGGAARVLGNRPGHTATLARIGFLPEHFRFHEWLQASEFLDLHGRLYGMRPEARRKRIPEVLELAALSDLVVEWRFLDGEVPGEGLLPGVGTGHGGGTAVAGKVASALELTVQHEDMLPIVAQRTLESGARLYALTPRKVSLEQLF